MLKTPFCDLFGIEVPIILAPMGTCTPQSLRVPCRTKVGWEGSEGSFRTTAAIKRAIDMMRKLTNRPFVINHISQTLEPEAVPDTLETRPPVISFTLANPDDLVRQAHRVARDVTGHDRRAGCPRR